eukprot:9482264-Pyramimonas_sp.AAC.1
MPTGANGAAAGPPRSCRIKCRRRNLQGHKKEEDGERGEGGRGRWIVRSFRGSSCRRRGRQGPSRAHHSLSFTLGPGPPLHPHKGPKL